MPPVPTLPPFSSASRPSPPLSSYSKDDKGKKPKPFAPPLSPPRRLPLLLLSALCLLVGVGGIVFAAVVLRRPPRTITIIRCGRAEDALRTFRSKSLAGDKDGVVARPKILGFVGVQTSFSSADRRAALRSTWFPSDPEGLGSLERATGLAFRFVIGRTKDSKKMADLRKEIDVYHDFMLIDVEEDYIRLPQKTLAFFKAAFNLFDADFYIKADDDIYLRPDRLATLLAKDRPHHLTYIGCMKKGPVITDPKMRWYESSGHLIGNEYFLHAYGPIYALSAEVVASLAIARNDSLRMFSNEDVTIGSWMLAMNVNHEDNRAICDPKCTPTSIAVWDIPRCSGLCNPVERMKELHNIGMCSKSPTLPLEEDK
ncbi:probable beta-1,3-galactosyltransferase 12 isoform X2 [Elaeis guineensis]|uniref:Hexosyltransferase n=1 Tax=Elaeis guineensis var. tenera TaxID=51953 RepID=A0A6I9QU98_ELAGV|nr:probable beta-1,3-galactosyltransferase 12 isoform X2 [Elaeis guineensis]